MTSWTKPDRRMSPASVQPLGSHTYWRPLLGSRTRRIQEGSNRQPKVPATPAIVERAAVGRQRGSVVRRRRVQLDERDRNGPADGPAERDPQVAGLLPAHFVVPTREDHEGPVARDLRVAFAKFRP